MTTKRVVIAALLAATVCVPAYAGEVWMSSGGVSYHTDRSKGYNERNPGVGLEYRWDTTHSLGAGAYLNSNRNISTLAVYTWTPLGNDVVRFGLLGGLAAGYASPVTPLILPAMTVQLGSVGATVVAWPSIRGGSGGVGVQFRVKVW